MTPIINVLCCWDAVTALNIPSITDERDVISSSSQFTASAVLASDLPNQPDRHEAK